MILFSSYFLAVLQSVDYVHPDGNIVFRTCSKEKDKLVFQMVIIKGCVQSVLYTNIFVHILNFIRFVKYDIVTEYLSNCFGLLWL